jgi:hypothetical protein
MYKPDRPASHMPAWLLARDIVLAEELERKHGAAFAAALLNDIGVVLDLRYPGGRRRLTSRISMRCSKNPRSSPGDRPCAPQSCC